jgi:multicomponent Na+:H+ antiporter subunit F
VAVALLLAAGTGIDAAVDVALTLALLAAFASIAFYKGAPGHSPDDSGADE